MWTFQRFSLIIFRYLWPIMIYLMIGTANQNSYAQGRLKIGTNLSGPDDWVSEWPLVDIMKYSRTWLTTNSTGGPWDTMVADSIPKDINGYPLEIPAVVAGQSLGTSVGYLYGAMGRLRYAFLLGRCYQRYADRV